MLNKTPDEIWNKILSELGEEGQKDPFLTQVEPVTLSGSSLTVSVPASFTMEKIEERYVDRINELLGSLVDDNVSLNFIVAEPQYEDFSVRHRKRASRSKSDDTHESSLNPRYTFDNFVVGRSNQLAHAASIAVAENPGKVYNPLFIYSRVGLGKTHLLHAIGNRVKERQPELKVLYVSSETFTNDLIEAIRNVNYLSNTSTTKFRNKYRTIDVLLIDDIQFLQKKESTQEEFFNTFNELYLNSKHIVLTSDKHPKNMPTLEERLRSRFEWGMVTDIVPPELETRIAILKQKSEEQGFGNLPDDVVLFIAEAIQSNIRDLEGALIRVVSTANIYKTDLTVELAREILKDTITSSVRRRKRGVTIEDIQKETADYFGVSVSDFKASTRTKAIVLPRQIAMYLAKQLIGGASYTEIGEAFGSRDHTTVMYACNKIEEVIQTDQDLKYDIDNLSNNIKK